MSESNENMIFVGHLSSSVRNEDLREFFEKVGPVESAFIIYDKIKHRSKGCAYVKFTKHDDYLKSFDLDGQELMGSAIRILENKRQDDKKSHDQKYSMRDRDYPSDRISSRYLKQDSDPYRRSPERSSHYLDRYDRGSPRYQRDSSEDLRDKIVSELIRDHHLLRDCLVEAVKYASDSLLEDVIDGISAIARRRREDRNDDYNDRIRRE